MKRLVLDAGPLIALFSREDTDHVVCKSGFEQLNQTRTVLLTPIPIIFEVYKWFLYKENPLVAQKIFKAMQSSLDTVSIDRIDLDTLHSIIQELGQWRGSLEDATVILMAQRYHCPVWTLNYRDFGAFSSLQFWNPS